MSGKHFTHQTGALFLALENFVELRKFHLGCSDAGLLLDHLRSTLRMRVCEVVHHTPLGGYALWKEYPSGR